jgi:hypothetical protein
MLVNRLIFIKAKVKADVVYDGAQDCHAHKDPPHYYFVLHNFFRLATAKPLSVSISDPVSDVLFTFNLLAALGQLRTIDLIKHVVHLTDFSKV